MKRFGHWLAFGMFAVWSVLFFGGCFGSSKDSASNGGPTNVSSNDVTVVSAPMAAMLTAAVGDRVSIYYPEVAENAIPNDSVIAKIQNGAMIVLSGTQKVGWVEVVSLPQRKTVLSTFEVQERLITVENLGSHQHGPTGAHSHPGIVKETYLDPLLFDLQIHYVVDELVALKLIDQAEGTRAKKKATQLLQPIVERIRLIPKDEPIEFLADKIGTEYLCRALGWKVVMVELANGMEQDPLELEASLRKWKLANPKGALLLTGRQTLAVKALLEKLELKTIRIDLIDPPADGALPTAKHYLQLMNDNLKRIEDFIENKRK